jgi:hypothetical protein
MSTITTTRTIRSLTCGVCGVLFGLESSFIDKRQDDGKGFYCPNGHSISWKANNEAKQVEQRLRKETDRVRSELEAARSLAQREANRRQLAERQRAAAKGQLTKTKNRIAKGVCPCCNRTFQNLGKHMAGQHPDFAGGDA